MGLYPELVILPLSLDKSAGGTLPPERSICMPTKPPKRPIRILQQQSQRKIFDRQQDAIALHEHDFQR